MFEVGERALTSPICSSWLRSLSSYPDTSDCITLRHTRRPVGSNWGFRSELFLSQTIKLVKMFHLVHKPLTTPSFLLVDVHCFLFCSCSLPPSVSVFVCLSFPLCAPCYWGMSSCCSNFTCWQLSPSVSLSFIFTPFYALSCLNSLMHFHKLSSSFFMAVLKGLLPEGNGDEERHAGWFPSATYLRVMGLRKSDPREFIMRITNPPLRVATLLLVVCRGW